MAAVSKNLLQFRVLVAVLSSVGREELDGCHTDTKRMHLGEGDTGRI